MAKRKSSGLPTMERQAGQQAEQTPELPSNNAVTAEEPRPTTVTLEIEVLPALLTHAHVNRNLNMRKLLTMRQAKALKCLVNMTSRSQQTQAVQKLLNELADAIELNCNVTL